MLNYYIMFYLDNSTTHILNTITVMQLFSQFLNLYAHAFICAELMHFVAVTLNIVLDVVIVLSISLFVMGLLYCYFLINDRFLLIISH